MASFVQRFRKKNSKLADSSVRTYLANIKRLAKMAGTKTTFPETGSWLSKKGLQTKLRALPLNARKILAAAGVKASQTYNVTVPAFVTLMTTATIRKKTRLARENTARENTLAGVWKGVQGR